MGVLGAPRMVARSFRQENQKAIPTSGRDPEAIWHIAYDTKTYTSAATVLLNYFDATNVGNAFLSNMEAAGQFPAPQVFDIHGVFADFWPVAAPVSTNAAVAGSANDLLLLLLVGQPIWTFTLQQKKYGPYPLGALHALAGVDTYFAGAPAAPGTTQYATNTGTPGWNYNGSITVPSQTSFQFQVQWTAAQTLSQNWLLKIAFSGKLSRAVK